MLRQKFNYHTHTYRCGHAIVCEDEDYVKEAIQTGYEVLGFSDHCPYPDRSKKTDRMDYEEHEGYLQSIHSLKEKYKDQIIIKTGFEMEYFPCYRDYIKEMSKKVDYMILGQHYNNNDAIIDYAYGDKNDDELIQTYGDLIEEGLHFHKWLYLAHPDYFCGGIAGWNEQCEKTAHQICKALVETNTPVEINIKLMRRKQKVYDGKLQYMYPFRQFWEIAKQYPLKCVYGMDAHNPTDLSSLQVYDIADGILEGLTFDMIKEPLIK